MSKKRGNIETDIRLHLVGTKKSKNDSDDDSVEFVESKSTSKVSLKVPRNIQAPNDGNMEKLSTVNVSTNQTAELKSFLSRFHIPEVKFNSKLTKESDVLDNLKALRNQQISVTQKIQELSAMQQRLNNDIRKATTKFNKVGNFKLAAKDDMPVEVAMKTLFPSVDIHTINKLMTKSDVCSATKCNKNSKFWNLSHLPTNFDDLIVGRLLDESKDVNLDFSESVEALPPESMPVNEGEIRPSKIAQFIDILENTSPSAGANNDAVNATENFLWSLLYGTDLENIVYSDSMEDLATIWLHKIHGSSNSECDTTELILAYLDYAKCSMENVLTGGAGRDTLPKLLDFLLEIAGKQQLLHARIGNVATGSNDNRYLMDLLMSVGKVLNDGLITAIVQFTTAYRQERNHLLCSSSGIRSHDIRQSPLCSSSGIRSRDIRQSPVKNNDDCSSVKINDLATIDLSEESTLSNLPELGRAVTASIATPITGAIVESYDQFIYEPETFDLDESCTHESFSTDSVVHGSRVDNVSTAPNNSSILSVETVVGNAKGKVITMDLTQQSDENNSSKANDVESVMLSYDEPCWDELSWDSLVEIATLNGVYVPNLTRERLVRLLVAVWKRKPRPLTNSSSSISVLSNSEQSTKDQVIDFIRNDPVITEQILTYIPIKIEELHPRLTLNNVKISKKELQEHLDSLLIFNTLGHKKSRQAK